MDKYNKFLNENKIILNVALTACWVNKEGNLIKFNEKFPSQTEVIREGINKKLIYILNHGLTHCILVNIIQCGSSQIKSIIVNLQII